MEGHELPQNHHPVDQIDFGESAGFSTLDFINTENSTTNEQLPASIWPTGWAEYGESSELAVPSQQDWSSLELRNIRGDMTEIMDGGNAHLDFIPAEYWPSMTPLDRWRNSPPELEAAPLTVIMNSVVHAATSELFNTDQSHSYRSLDRRPTPSVASSESVISRLSSSSGSSAHSFSSNNSHGSFGKFYVNEKPRRRRRQQKVSTLRDGRKRSETDKRPYQCTFCTDRFKSKYDWTRHERTLHLSLESWTCAPFGPTYRDSADDGEKCTFCDIMNPSTDHMESHRYQDCTAKPPVLRTFYRKDHLRQHLRLVHGVERLNPSMEKWKSEVTEINSRCGFCGQSFRQWHERNNHIAEHYRSGTSIKAWRGCRGLDATVSLAVENAMPPYLIGIETTNMEPFSASRLGNRPGFKEIPRTGTKITQNEDSSFGRPQPTPFEYLTVHLRQFVRETQMTNTLLTDEMIQQEARRFVYGDDDPWNQTAADNSEWLQLFKEAVGLESCPSAGQHLCDADRAWDMAVMGHPLNSGDVIASEPASAVDPWIPWSWQNPECLVEFRRQALLSKEHAFPTESSSPENGIIPDLTLLHTPGELNEVLSQTPSDMIGWQA